MVRLPSGTVTFVFSDIEASTTLLKQLGAEDYATLLAVHRRLVREIFAAHEGSEIDTQGDAFFYSFIRARQAVAAAVELQRAHVKASWPGGVAVRVRLGLHTGEPVVGDEGYTGLDVVRASRIAAAGTGGQVLLSESTRAIVSGDLEDGVSLRALGDRSLKDIERPEALFELVIDGALTPGEDVPRTAPDGQELLPDDAAPKTRPLDRERTREAIEERVLAQIERSLGSGFPFGVPKPPKRSEMTGEIARLHELHEDGALSDDQYRRAVDRLLAEDGRS